MRSMWRGRAQSLGFFVVITSTLVASSGCSNDDRPPTLPGGGGVGPSVLGGSSDPTTAPPSTFDGGVPDGPEVDAPSGIDCRVSCDCPQGERCLRNRCVPAVPGAYCCSKTGCPDGLACTFPDGSAGFCPSAGELRCATHCDCPPLTACRSGLCEPSADPAYCCTDLPCPSDEACVYGDGVPGLCP